MKKKISKEKETPLKPGCLTANELMNAEVVLVKYVQAKEYPDWMNYLFRKTTREVKRDFLAVEVESILQDGLIKVGGRLENSSFSYEVKHPTILPQNSLLASLVINYHHCILNHVIRYGHVKRREEDYVGKRMMKMAVPGRRKRGRPRRR